MSDSVTRLAAQQIDWHGAMVAPSIGPDGGAEFWRLPRRELEASVSDPEVAFRARTATGLHARLKVEGARIRIRLELDPGEDRLDVLVDGALHRRPVGGGWQEVGIDLTPGEHDIAIVLPGEVPARVAHVEVEGRATPTPQSARPTWVAYGSSITQGLKTSGPSDAWPWRVASDLDVNGINIGLGGQCHVDPFIADWLRSVQADVFTFCLGINIQGKGTLSRRTLHPAVVGFLRRVREGHPGTPFVVITPLFCAERETTPNAVGLTLREVRVIVAEAAEAAADLDGGPLRIVDGTTLIGEADGALMPDGLHPGSEGHALIAQRLAPALRQALA